MRCTLQIVFVSLPTFLVRSSPSTHSYKRSPSSRDCKYMRNIKKEKLQSLRYNANKDIKSGLGRKCTPAAKWQLQFHNVLLTCQPTSSKFFKPCLDLWLDYMSYICLLVCKFTFLTLFALVLLYFGPQPVFLPGVEGVRHGLHRLAHCVVHNAKHSPLWDGGKATCLATTLYCRSPLCLGISKTLCVLI